jgi:hypothetical protein
MYPYWLMFGLLAGGAFLSSDPRTGRWRPLFLGMVVVLTLFIGLRFEVAPDWSGYLNIWEWTKRLSLSSAIARGDIGYLTLTWALHQLHAEFWALNLICATIFMAGLASFARRMVNPWLAVCVAYPYLVLVLAMSGVRQATAIGFFFFALGAFFDKRLIRATLFLLLASVFHASAIVMLGVAAMAMTQNRLAGAAVLALTVFMGVFVLDADFQTYINRYAGQSTESVQSAGVWYRLAMNLLPSLLFLGWNQRFELDPRVRSLWKILAYLSLACIPAFFVISSSTALDRFSLYLSPIQVFVLSSFPYAFTNDSRNMRLAVAGVLAYLFVVLFVFLTFSAYISEWNPYQSYLFSNTG